MVQKLVAASITGVIDQDINAAQAFNHGPCHMLHLLCVRHIARDCQALTTHFLDLCHQLFEFGGSAGSHCHICPCPGQCQGDAATNPTASACHDCAPS